MSKWLDTRGNKPIAIAVCARCSCKVPITSLREDPNYPGLFCCGNVTDGCIDVLDPWRLPSRETENISLDQPRPDRTIIIAGGTYATSYPQEQAVIGVSGGFSMLGANGGEPIGAAGVVTTLQQPRPWAPNAQVALGAQVTPGNPVGMAAAGEDIYVFECIMPGKTGATAPTWVETISALIVDGGVLWQCANIYLP